MLHADEATHEAFDFPLNPDQGWYTRESYLILKPYLDDADYASRTTTSGDLGTEVDLKVRLEKPDFDWYSGVRLAVGRYLPNHNQWDIAFSMTYFYANETDESSPHVLNGATLDPLWLGLDALLAGATQASVQWLLNYFTWDLTAGREFQFLKTVVAHPYIGLRAALINQDYKATYFNNGEDVTNPTTMNAKFKGDGDFWGIGPRAGIDFQFNLGKYWLLLGSFSGSIFYGNLSLEEKIDIDQVYLPTNKPYSDNAKGINNTYCVRSNIEGSIGIGWEAWVRNRTVRIAPSLLFEAAQWFGANQFFALDTSSTDAFDNLTMPSMNRHYGDLALVGFSFNLQVDF